MDYYEKIEQFSKQDKEKVRYKIGSADRFSGILTALLYVALYHPAKEYAAFVAGITADTNINFSILGVNIYELLPYSCILAVVAGCVYFLFGRARILMYAPVPVLMLYFILPYMLAFQ
jgi:hypothetical protein